MFKNLIEKKTQNCSFQWFFFTDMSWTKRQIKRCPRFPSFEIFLEQSVFWLLSWKIRLQNWWKFCNKKYGYSVVKQSVRNVCKVWSQLFQPFLYWGSSSIYHSESSENIIFTTQKAQKTSHFSFSYFIFALKWNN